MKLIFVGTASELDENLPEVSIEELLEEQEETEDVIAERNDSGTSS